MNLQVKLGAARQRKGTDLNMRSRWRLGGIGAILILAVGVARAADPSTEPASQPVPQYPVEYGPLRPEQIAASLHNILAYLNSATDANKATDRRFSPLAYPMGVVYAGMLSAADATGDKAFADFDEQRFQFFADSVAKLSADGSATEGRGPFRGLLAPYSLDSCGAIGSAFVKGKRAGLKPDLTAVIDRFAKYISQGQFRLDDGTLARNVPYKNSVWGDDMYMSVPFLAQMAVLSGDGKYFDDAAKQVLQIGGKLFVPSEGLFTHAWNGENPDDHPKYYWGRANGWCMMAMAELLEVLPQDHPQRPAVLKLFRAASMGVAGCQSGSGLWHQMLDRTDSYLETSCSAMFTFALARGVNRGWLDASAYGPVAQAGWEGVSSRISADGHVTGTCIGTSYADDYIYYYSRPCADDVHGYGPTLLAGAEMIRLLKNEKLRIQQTNHNPIYYLPRNRPAEQ